MVDFIGQVYPVPFPNGRLCCYPLHQPQQPVGVVICELEQGSSLLQEGFQRGQGVVYGLPDSDNAAVTL